jgi:autotransporter-associated beta strand protein
MKSHKRGGWQARGFSFLCTVVFAVGLLPQGAPAANVNWVGDTDANWNTPANWSAGIADQVAVFGVAGSAGSNLNNNMVGLTLSGLTFSAGASIYTINGNAITMAGGITNLSTVAQTNNLDMIFDATRTIVGSAGGNTVLGGIISGAGGITKNNSQGNLTLAGANTYTGPTTMSRGTLFVTSLNSVVGGTASSSLGAPTTVTNGTISLGTGAQAGILNYSGNGETTDRVLSLAGTSGGATLDQSGASGLLKFTSGLAATGAGSKTFTLQGSAAGTGEFAGAITNNSALNTTAVTKSGTGQWTLSGVNTYSGVTTISGGGGLGTLVLNNANALPGGIGAAGGTSALTFNNGILGLGADNFYRNLGAAGVVTAVNFTGAGGWAAYGADRIVNLNNDSHQIVWGDANTGFNGQQLILGSPLSDHLLDFQNPLDLGAGERIVATPNGSTNKLSGDISGSGSLLKTGGAGSTGGGVLILSGSNTFTGNVGFKTSGAGGLSFSSDANLGAGTTITMFQNDSLITTADVTTDKGIVFGGGNSANQDIRVAAGTTFTVNGIISSANLVTNAYFRKHSSTGTLVLTGSNTFGERVQILAGTLSINSIKNIGGVANALGQPADATQGAINIGATTVTAGLTYTGAGDTSDRIINLSGATGGAILDQSGTGLLKFTEALTATGNGTKTLTLQGSTVGIGELAGAIVDSLNATRLVKAGSGTWTLSGINTYSGGTTISNGTLALAGSGSVGSGAIDIKGGALFDVSGTAAGSYTLAGSQSLTNRGSMAGGLIIGSGASVSGGGSFSGAVTNGNGGFLTPGIGGDTNFFSSLTLAGGSTNSFWMGATAANHDMSAVSNGLSYSGNGLLMPELKLDLSIYTWHRGDTFVLYDNLFSGMSVLNGTNQWFTLKDAQGLTLDLKNRTFFNTPVAAGSETNLFLISYDFDADGNGQFNDIALTAIPEPASVNLLALWGIAYWLRRRRHGSGHRWGT